MKVLTLYTLVVIFSVLFLAYMHEQVHVEIFRHYGIESHIEYFSNFPSIVTVAERECPNDYCTLAHDINEVVSYHLDSFFFIIAFGFLSVIFLMGEKEVND